MSDTPPGEVTRNLRDGVLYIQDDGDNELEINLDEGDVNIKWSVEDRLVNDRGALSHFRAGDEVPTDVSFSAKVSKITADDTAKGGTDTTPSVYEALMRLGLAAGWATTGYDGEPYLCTLVFKIANPDPTGRMEVITCGKFRASAPEFAEGEENDTLSFTGRGRLAPVFTYEAQ